MRTGRDALTTLSAEVLSRAASLVLAVFTARILDPLDVGTLGLSVLLVGLVSMLSFFPENAAVILESAKSDSDRAFAGLLARLSVTAVLTTIAFLGVSLAAAMLGGDVKGATKIRQLTTLLLWLPWIEVATSYPRILLRRRLDLSYVAAMQLVGTLLFVTSAVALLLSGFGQVSVVWAQLLGTAVVAGLAWHRVVRTLDLAAWSWPPLLTWSALIGESTRLMAGGVGGYVTERLDNLLVAASLGPANASFYSVAWNLARVPVNTLAQAVYSVVVPAIAVARSDPDRVTKTLRSTFRFSSLVLALVGSLLFFHGPSLVEGVLGAKWQPLAPGLRVMAFTILNAPIQFAAGALLMTTKRAHLIGLATASHIVAQVILIPPLCAGWGVLGAAYADLAGTTLVSALLLLGIFQTSGMPKWLDFRMLLGPTLAAFGAAASTIALLPRDPAPTRINLLALLLSPVLYLAIIATMGGLDSLRELALLIRDWCNGLRSVRSR